jgi:uncharacterized protein (TIGR03086 family)
VAHVESWARTRERWQDAAMTDATPTDANESIAERYRRRAAAFAATIAAVPDDAWADQSPCDEWTTRDVVRHVVGNEGTFAGFLGRQLEEGPSIDDDPLGAFESATAQTQAWLDDPEVAATEFDGMMGRRSWESAVDQFSSFDLVIHRWDLGKAAGLDVRIDDADVAAMLAMADSVTPEFDAVLRSPGVFGPALDVPEGASDQVRALAFVGRRDW